MGITATLGLGLAFAVPAAITLLLLGVLYFYVSKKSDKSSNQEVIPPSIQLDKNIYGKLLEAETLRSTGLQSTNTTAAQASAHTKTTSADNTSSSDTNRQAWMENPEMKRLAQEAESTETPEHEELKRVILSSSSSQ